MEGSESAAVEKRRLSTDSELLSWGNSERDVNSKAPLLCSVVTPRIGSDYACDSCQLAFTTAFALQLHYSAAHECQCHICGVPLVSHRVLEMHIAEFHDAFFAARAKRGGPVYPCLVLGCQKAFKSKHGRSSHMAMVHRFSHDFATAVLNPGSLSKRTRPRRQSKNRGRQGDSVRAQPTDQSLSADMELSLESGSNNKHPEEIPP